MIKRREGSRTLLNHHAVFWALDNHFRVVVPMGAGRSGFHPSYLHGDSALSRASSRYSGGKGLLTGSDPDPDTVLPFYCDRAVCFSRAAASRRTGSPVPVGARRSAFDGHAAALSDGHVPQAADRLASTRARRAATARDVRSAGTASAVPKYISSGVWPRNAEWGSTRLCSWT